MWINFESNFVNAGGGEDRVCSSHGRMQDVGECRQSQTAVKKAFTQGVKRGRAYIQ